MLELLLIRHGQIDWNIEQRVMGRRPIPLNDTGRAQARRLAEYLDGVFIDKLYSSPVERAMETAWILTAGDGEDSIKAALLHLLRIDYKELVHLSIDNCALVLVRFSPDVGPRLVLYNPMNGFGRDLY